MSFRVRRSDEAIRQFRTLPPDPKRRVKDALRELTRNPYGHSTLQMEASEPTYRVRVDDHRILFNPGPGLREITIFRIAPRPVAYRGYDRSPRGD